MNVIIVGAGLVGFQVARRLIEEGKNVTLVEQSEDAARYAMSRLDCMVITGQGNNMDMLRQAGIDKAQAFIALTGSDEVNMICCSLVASEYPSVQKLARVRNLEYLETSMTSQRYLGIDFIINPDAEVAKVIIHQLDTGARNYIMGFENLDVQIQRIPVNGASSLARKSIHQLRHQIRIPFIIPLIQRDDSVIIPDGSTMILEGDELYIAAKEDDMRQLPGFIGEKQSELKRILIVGGGSIGRMILHHLLREQREDRSLIRRLARFFNRSAGRSIRVVERDYQKCKKLSETFPEALVIHADISEENVFEEERLNESDILITSTENPELNIVASLYARKIGIEKVITLVRTENYTRIASELGIQVSVSLKNTVINSIIRYLLKGNITSMHSAAHGMIEFMELQVHPESRIAGHRIRDLVLPPETLILYISRENEQFIPDGEAFIKPDDHVLILARKESLSRIEDLVKAIHE